MAGVLEHFRGTDTGIHLGKLARQEDPGLYGAHPQQEFQDAVVKLKAKLREQRFEELQEKARAASLSESEKREFAALLGNAQKDEEAGA